MGERPGPALDVLRATFFASLPRYEYLSPLGQGGTGYVFKAIDRELKRLRDAVAKHNVDAALTLLRNCPP